MDNKVALLCLSAHTLGIAHSFVFGVPYIARGECVSIKDSDLERRSRLPYGKIEGKLVHVLPRKLIHSRLPVLHQGNGRHRRRNKKKASAQVHFVNALWMWRARPTDVVRIVVHGNNIEGPFWRGSADDCIPQPPRRCGRFRKAQKRRERIASPHEVEVGIQDTNAPS
jgi:hypothetical protein